MWWITAGCLLVKVICSHLKVTQAPVEIWQASETSQGKSSPGNFHHQYLPELHISQCEQLSLDGEKCVLLLCAWKPAFSNSITYNYWKRGHLGNLSNVMFMLFQNSYRLSYYQQKFNAHILNHTWVMKHFIIACKMLVWVIHSNRTLNNFDYIITNVGNLYLCF